MTAYELAKYIEDDIQIQEGVADMLRQQADRIAELEKGLEDYSGEVDDGVKFVGTLPDGHPLKMSKPVAWITEPALTFLNNYACNYNTIEVQKKQDEKFSIPLYTHPVKQLSDEEIANIWAEHTKIAGTYDVKDIIFPFARAIIKEITE